MSSFLKYLEKAWLVAAAVSFIVMLYNLVRLRVFDSHVYFPLICGLFCILIWNNVKSQRKFREKMEKELPTHQKETEESGTNDTK